MKYEYKTKGVCSTNIAIDIEGETLKCVQFTGGCHGNLQGLAKLVEGMNIDEVIARLENIRCGGKATSCPDQLAAALRLIKQQQTT